MHLGVGREEVAGCSARSCLHVSLSLRSPFVHCLLVPGNGSSEAEPWHNGVLQWVNRREGVTGPMPPPSAAPG
jgi:hypothetical protein